MDLNKTFSLWPLVPFGGEDPVGQNDGNDPGQNSGSQSNQQRNQGNSGSGANPPAGQANSSSTDDDDDEDEFKDYSAKELRRIAREATSRAKSAETERDSVKGELTKQERDKLDKEARLELDVKDRDQTISTLRATNAKLAIINAINSDSRYQWHNAEVVAQQLNPEIVKVSDDGKVEGIAKELVRVAKDHSYLLKTKQQERQQNNGPAGSFSGSTGSQPGQGGATQGGTTKSSIQELAENYPALAARM